MPSPTPTDNLPHQLAALERRIHEIEADRDLLRSSNHEQQRRIEHLESRQRHLDEALGSLRRTHENDQEASNQRWTEMSEWNDKLHKEVGELDVSIGALLGEGASTARLTHQIEEKVNKALDDVRNALNYDKRVMRDEIKQGLANVRDALNIQKLRIEQQIAATHQAALTTLKQEGDVLRGEFKAGDAVQANLLAKLNTKRRLLMLVAMGLAPSMKDALWWIWVWAKSKLGV